MIDTLLFEAGANVTEGEATKRNNFSIIKILENI